MQFDLMWLAPVGSILALVFSAYLIYKVLKEPRGTKEMIELQDAIEEGARAYIKRQYGVVSIFFAVVVTLLFVMYKQGYLTVYVPFAFLSGGFFSALAGFIGLWVATKANARTAFGATKSLNTALRIAFSGGTRPPPAHGRRMQPTF